MLISWQLYNLILSSKFLLYLFIHGFHSTLFSSRTKLLLQVSVRELHNSIVSDSNYGGLKYARDEDYNIIISDSTLHSLFPPQLKQMSVRYKIMCGC